MTLNNILYLYINVVSYLLTPMLTAYFILITVVQWDNHNTRITNSPLAYSP